MFSTQQQLKFNMLYGQFCSLLWDCWLTSLLERASALSEIVLSSSCLLSH